jgi:hypothetical protein
VGEREDLHAGPGEVLCRCSNWLNIQRTEEDLASLKIAYLLLEHDH